MSELTLATLLLGSLFALLALGVWVAFSLLTVGMLAMIIFTDTDIGLVLASTLWGHSSSWALAALPLFIWLSEILFRSSLSDDLFNGIAPWVEKLPGRLLHVNIFACALFATVSGSSAATAATVGKLSVPELKRRGYTENMTLGTIAGSATLGLLIPPSIVLIVYGVATEQSIARLFLAGVLPGLLLVFLFVGYVVIWSLLNKEKLPTSNQTFTLREKLHHSKRLIPILLLVSGVIGSIYIGIASPTDAAAIGVIIALILSYRTGSLNWKTFFDGLMSATKTSCMIAFILVGAAFLTVAMTFTGMPILLAEWLTSFQLSYYQILIVLSLFFIVMGLFLDGISVVVLTTSIIMPIVYQAGIDPLWFGIFLVIIVEMAQITPPVGFNLFVIKNLTDKGLMSIAWASLPFFLLMALGLIIITLVPQIVTVIPNLM